MGEGGYVLCCGVCGEAGYVLCYWVGGEGRYVLSCGVYDSLWVYRVVLCCFFWIMKLCCGVWGDLRGYGVVLWGLLLIG